MNPLKAIQLQNAWRQFQRQHPKFTRFLKDVSQNGVSEGTIIEIHISSPEGKNSTANLRVTKEDLDLLLKVRGMSGSKR